MGSNAEAVDAVVAETGASTALLVIEEKDVQSSHRKSRPSEFAASDRDVRDFDRNERRFWASCDGDASESPTGGFDVECAARVGRDEDARRERLVRSSTPSSFARWGTPAARDRLCPSIASTFCPTVESPTD